MRRPRLTLLNGTIVLIPLALVLLIADMLCYQLTLPVEIDMQGSMATLHVGSEVLPLGSVATPLALRFTSSDPVVHEYQLDGTDSTNNFTLDPPYLHHFASSAYYRFQAWMRDLDGTSRWRDLRVWSGNHLLEDSAWPTNGELVSLPPLTSLRLSMLVQRPETPMRLDLLTKDGSTLHIVLDRNDRYIMVTHSVPGIGTNLPVASIFFPVDTAPFAAMVIDTLIRTLLWALLALLIVIVGETAIALAKTAWLILRREGMQTGKSATRILTGSVGIQSNTRLLSGLSWPGDYLHHRWQRLDKALHPVALAALGASLIFVSWTSYVQYSAEPHFYDANAYFFAAKMYASGYLSVPIPPAIDRFPGPFMVQFHGQWFGQYAPGTALTLVPGLWLGVPWLLEPVLGTLALLGIGLVAARLYDRRVATLAVILGALSPFYTYLAASYLSHAITLFYLVWGLWAIVRFTQGKPAWNLLLSAAFFGMAWLTRDLVAVLFVAIVLPGMLALSWRSLHLKWSHWIRLGGAFAAVALVFVGITLSFNALLTGDALVTPRQLFFAGDHWGFGQGVGFYGQHTLAAGFVNLDELLTSLAIDLFGWPFYLTFAFLPMPFLTRRAVGADWLMLAGTAIMTGAWVGYFYHGIYLGPRYLFETLPFLLILTARGILTLAACALEVGHSLSQWLFPGRTAVVVQARPTVSVITIVLITALVACNILYFMPRQIVLHQDYTGLAASHHIDVQAVYHPPVHKAIIVTDDYTLYQIVLFPLNDPLLHGDDIYAWATNASQYAELHQAFPGRVIYHLTIIPNGSVQYTPVSG